MGNKSKAHKEMLATARICVYGALLVILVLLAVFSAGTGSERRQLATGDAETLLPWLALDPDSWYMIIFYIMGMMWLFVGMAIICDEYFVPALEVIADELDITEDVAGATLMAAGGSAPEFFTSLIGTFQESDVGFGTIVGSAVFNVLFVIGMCAIFSNELLRLTWWPLFRDICYYIFGLTVLSIVFKATSPSEIWWYESLILFSMYLGYVFIMRNNEAAHKWFTALFGIEGSKPGIDSTLMNFRNPQNFRAGILHLLIGEKSLFDTVPYKVITSIRGDLEDTFKMFDKNGDGSIQKHELQEMFQQLGCDLQAEELNALYKRLDTNDDGTIEFDEFAKWYTSSEHRIDMEMKQLFKKYDYNNDETIEVSALQQLLLDCKLENEETLAAAEQAILTDAQRLERENMEATGQLLHRHTTAREALDEIEAVAGHHDQGIEGLWTLQSSKTAEIVGNEIIWYDATTSDISVEYVKNANRGVVTLTFQGEDHVGLLSVLDEGLANERMAIRWFDNDLWEKRSNPAITFPMFKKWYEDQMFYKDKKETAEEEAEAAVTLEELLDFPSDSGLSGQFWYIFSLFFMFMFYFTVPDTRRYNRGSLKWAVASFLMSIMWIGVFSVCLVDWATIVGQYLGIPVVVMGVTVLAAGTSIPDLLSSVIVAQRGFGDMAVSSSVGSNIFDILFCLPVPWFFYSVLYKKPFSVEADSLGISILVLIGMIVSVITIIMYNDWAMTQNLGYCMFVLYIIFLIQNLTWSFWENAPVF